MRNMFERYRTVSKVSMVPIDQIIPNPAQPRKTFNEQELFGLAESIRVNGLLQPITLRRREGGGFEIVAGERRFRAAKSIGFTEVPCIIENITKENSAILALVENIQRSDLNFFEHATAIQALMGKWDMNQEQLAEKLGKTQGAIANKLRLLRFSQPIKEKILSHKLTERHARALLKLENHIMLSQVIDYIAENELTVAESERYIDALVANGSAPSVTRNIKRKKRKLLLVRDIRVFTNSIEKAIQTIKLAGIQADIQVSDSEDEIEYSIKIPKVFVSSSKK